MCTHPRRSRRGLTFVELLVVLSITAIGFAMAAPGILHARTQARADICRNNLKQIGLALHNYHAAFATFPPGWVARDVKPATGPCFGWQSFLLPFVDGAPLYNRLNFSAPPDPANADLQTRIVVFRCPDDTSDDLNPVRDEFGTSNYSASYGDAALPGSVDAARKVSGIFYWNSKTRIADITDGTSNVFQVGERCISSAAGIWVGVRSNQNAGDTVTACNHEARLNTVIDSYSSRHGDGAHFLFCDGAVRFISDEIDSLPFANLPKGLYQKLAHRNDGQQVGGF
jgi:prepilin-type N-terminal cleavage/methylation domain-containing protein/prepilin-type processing-associated H-X9-DG protein